MGMSDSHYSMEVRGAGDSVVIIVFVSSLQVQGLTEKKAAGNTKPLRSPSPPFHRLRTVRGFEIDSLIS